MKYPYSEQAHDSFQGTEQSSSQPPITLSTLPALLARNLLLATQKKYSPLPRPEDLPVMPRHILNGSQRWALAFLDTSLLGNSSTAMAQRQILSSCFTKPGFLPDQILTLIHTPLTLSLGFRGTSVKSKAVCFLEDEASVKVASGFSPSREQRFHWQETQASGPAQD